MSSSKKGNKKKLGPKVKAETCGGIWFYNPVDVEFADFSPAWNVLIADFDVPVGALIWGGSCKKDKNDDR